MIKGKVNVTLTDVITNKKEEYSQENLITNRTEQIFKLKAGRGSIENVIPIAERLLGGLYIFESSITAQATNFDFPNSSKFVGLAGRAQNTAYDWIGSLNSSETGAISGGYKNVWDFATNQCNGTIGAFSLTYVPQNNCLLNGVTYIPDLCDYTSLNQYRCNSDYPIYYDESTQRIYYISSGSIKSQYAQFGKFLVITGNSIYDEKTEASVTLPFNIPSNEYYNYCEDGYTYVWKTTNNTTLSYYTIETKNKTFVVSSQTDITLANNGYCKLIEDGYAYIRSSTDGTILYKVSLSDLSSTTITLTHSADSIQTLGSNVILANSGNNVTFIYPDESTKVFTGSVATSHIKNRKIAECGKYIRKYSVPGEWYLSSFAPSTCFLGTICNLSAPITKTNTQTMKITYTLTNA